VATTRDQRLCSARGHSSRSPLLWQHETPLEEQKSAEELELQFYTKDQDEASTHQPPEEGVALEEPLGRLLVEGEELPGGGADEG